MLHARTTLRKGQLGPRAIVDTITLDRQSRHRRRVVLKTDGGRELLLDLATATYLADGDALLLDSGGVVLVKAAAEELTEIKVDDTLALARIAWHLGNRHTPAEVTERAIYIQPDHVLEEMVMGLGARAQRVMRPFEPEGGAYGGHGPLQHGHHHHHDHSHSHDHPPEAATAPRREQPGR
jgi:urease accessory protein